MRIASLVPSATEMLFALGLGDDVVAVTTSVTTRRGLDNSLTSRSVIPENLEAAEIGAPCGSGQAAARPSMSSTTSCSRSSAWG